jgi:uncharacterized protein
MPAGHGAAAGGSALVNSIGILLLIAAAGFWAGAQNALAGGGSFITFPVLLFAGLDPRAANITSTVALFPGQLAMSWSGRGIAAGVQELSLITLIALSLVGGAIGALLLLLTPASFFARLVPWLVLFATLVFALGHPIRRRLPENTHLPAGLLTVIQSGIAVYGGYFGGGIGLLMLAALTLAGQSVRIAATTKNLLATVMNAAAVLVFCFSRQVHWEGAASMALGSVAGGLTGSWLLLRAPEVLLRGSIIAIGIALTVWLFLH